jgi:hypothetical protein
MATKYALQQKGVADGTKIPPDKSDARQVLGHKLSLIASKDAAAVEAWNSGDVIYLGRKPAGFKITSIKVTTDTSFATSTLSVGVGGDPRAGGAVVTAAKYANAKTVTAVDTPTIIGPLASQMVAAVPDEEHLWLTIGVANIAAAVVASLEIEMSGVA